MNSAYIDHKLDLLKQAIIEILNQNIFDNFEELYLNAYTLVLHKYGDRLYKMLNDTVTDHLRNNVRPCIEESPDTDALNKLIEAWNDHTTAMAMIRDILIYLDKVYVVQQKNAVDTVYNLGLRLFFGKVVNRQRPELISSFIENLILKTDDLISNLFIRKNVFKSLLYCLNLRKPDVEKSLENSEEILLFLKNPQEKKLIEELFISMKKNDITDFVNNITKFKNVFLQKT
ncbi:hypothetical protein FO519_007574 [Halicephalobus sp. NKZ332]|nr:hypothetical protein FO519_007574 [Halicephalobus sp. NKZ332]